MNALRHWMKIANGKEQEALAKTLNPPTSVAMLRHYANGFRLMSVARAIDVERATKILARESRGRLPVVDRIDMVKECRNCDHALKCLGRVAVEAASWPITEEPVR